MTLSPKARTNRKFVANKAYRDTYDEIFGKKKELEQENSSKEISETADKQGNGDAGGVPPSI